MRAFYTSKDEKDMQAEESGMKENTTLASMKITQISLMVKSQAEALEFYTKKLGFEKKIDFPTPAGYRWIVVGPKGNELGLALVEVGWKDDSGLGQIRRAGEGGPIVIQVDDCAGTYQELKSRGVQFKRVWGEELQKTSYGTVAFLADPDGNLYELLEPSKAVQTALNVSR
jgi:catechol 2,3-dioxygenase-like lactoylglutathione lyase family enzyme